MAEQLLESSIEQVLSIQAEQVNGKNADIETTASQFKKVMPVDKKFKVC